MVNTGFHHRLPFVAAAATLDKLVHMDLKQHIRDCGNKFLASARNMLTTTEPPLEVVGNGNLFQLIFRR